MIRIVWIVQLGLTCLIAPASRGAEPDDPGAWKTGAGASIQRDRREMVSRIAFGSCFKTDFPLGVWDVIREKARPDLFLFIGDVIYKDTRDMAEKRREFGKLAAAQPYDRFRKSVEVMAMWDDHDYGENDGGADYPMRDESKRVFLGFFGEPEESPRWRKAGGMSGSAVFGEAGRRVQVILLDGRYHRSRTDRDPVHGGYRPVLDPKATMLGDEQWKWLEERLREPAEVRLICSGIQVIAQDQPNEKWDNLPRERQRLLKLIQEVRANGVIFLSGDRHHGEISMLREPEGPGYALFDVTSSGMNCPHRPWVEANRHRVGELLCTANFGLVEIDWNRADPQVSLVICDGEGTARIRQRIALSSLRPR